MRGSCWGFGHLPPGFNPPRQERQRCVSCDEETGRAGAEDELRTATGEGPFCEACWELLPAWRRGDDE
jgi:hypothetical protein